MKHFQEILVTLGASDIKLVEENAEWDFWSVSYRTPVGSVNGFYLYLKHKCPLKQGNSTNTQRWDSLSSRAGYEIVLTPQSPLSVDMLQTKQAFKGKNIKTSKQLLLENFLREFPAKPIIGEEDYFVDPNLELENETTVHDATKYLISWFGNKRPESKDTVSKDTSLAVLTANGGVGKTTVSRIICSKIKLYDPTAIPILIESEQWRHLLQSTITLDTLWDLALNKRFEHASRLLGNPTALRVLIREGLFVVVFDGFDELCLNSSSAYRPRDIILELIQLLTPEDEVCQAKILLTTRETYWDTVSDELDLEQIEVFRLKGFDNEQRKRYFENRLKNASERDLALRLAKEVAGGVYNGVVSTSDLNEERLSGVPFILDLIARYVHENDDPATINPYQPDSFSALLEHVCRRENRRQSLDLDPSQQFQLFEELFREFRDGITFDDLKLHLEIICGVTDQGVIDRFTNHVFLIKLDQNVYAPRYDVLRVYFIARFLAHELATVGSSSRRRVAEVLAENSIGKTQVLDWLITQLRRLDDSKLNAAITQAIDIVNHKENEAVRSSSARALFHLISNLIIVTDKRERTHELAKRYNAKETDFGWIFNRISLADGVKSFDFSGCEFVNSRLVAVDFRNCTFDEKSLFKSCIFESMLNFTNCKNPERIQVINETVSREAEYALNEIRKRGSRIELKQTFSEDALLRALKRFRSDFGFYSIQYRHRKSGFKPGNPFNDQVWDELLRAKIIERHTISNVEEGGVKISDNKELRREVASFLDNGVPGSELRKVVSALVDGR